jgi:hypothetical protein
MHNLACHQSARSGSNGSRKQTLMGTLYKAPACLVTPSMPFPPLLTREASIFLLPENYTCSLKAQKELEEMENNQNISRIDRHLNILPQLELTFFSH